MASAKRQPGGVTRGRGGGHESGRVWSRHCGRVRPRVRVVVAPGHILIEGVHDGASEKVVAKAAARDWSRSIGAFLSSVICKLIPPLADVR